MDLIVNPTAPQVIPVPCTFSGARGLASLLKQTFRTCLARGEKGAPCEEKRGTSSSSFLSLMLTTMDFLSAMHLPCSVTKAAQALRREHRRERAGRQRLISGT